MRLNPKAFAHASATVVGVLYLACAGLTMVAPNFLLSLGNSWFHAVDIAKIKDINITFGSLLWGLVSIVVVVWIFDYLFAVAYNSFTKRQE